LLSLRILLVINPGFAGCFFPNLKSAAGTSFFLDHRVASGILIFTRDPGFFVIYDAHPGNKKTACIPAVWRSATSGRSITLRPHLAMSLPFRSEQ
jgi:hypothetical protein